MNKNLNSLKLLSIQNILKKFSVDKNIGLSPDQVQASRAQFGVNQISKIEPRTKFSIILETFKEPMMLLLLAIGMLAFFFGKIGSAIAMVLEVVIYATLELVNKFRSDKLMTHLQKLASPTVKVLRSGVVEQIPNYDVVVGDIILLFEGVSVCADALLLTSFSLLVNEASLTGESFPIEKLAVEDENNNPENIHMVFAGTTIASGEGLAMVVAIGDQTKIGNIAEEVQKYTQEQTVVQKTMDQLANILAIVAIVISIIIPAIGILHGFEFEEMVLTWLSLTFLMIPCQPPIIITMALSLAAFFLAKKDVIAKRLFGIEGVGQVSMIVSDKTGTITKSKLTFDEFCTLQGAQKNISQPVQEMIRLALPDFCTHVMDVAILETLQVEKKTKKAIKFFGFTAHHMFRDIVYQQQDGQYLHMITGSPERLLAFSNVSDEQKKLIQNFIDYKAQEGCKLIAYASKQNDSIDFSALEQLDFLAVAAVKDPVRPGVKEAIHDLMQAGISTIIVTGDHQLTAQAVAAEIGLKGTVITGDEFEKLDDQSIFQKCKSSTIFARMTSGQKLRLVEILRKNNEIVGVIGDGVNDAPAIRAANVGIAMGLIGTDLAKDVADLILTDDNYVHLPDTISISRTALDNFKKGLTFYLAAKFVLLIIFIVPLLIGTPFPLSAIHIILIELLLDVSSSTIFVIQPAEPDVMNRPSEKIQDFLGWPLVKNIVTYGLPLAIGILSLYAYNFYYYDALNAQTVALVSWLLGHVLLAYNVTQNKRTIINQGLSNIAALFWIGFMIFCSVVLTTSTTLHFYMKTTSLSIHQWLSIFVVVVVTTFWIEVAKYVNIHKRY